MRPISLSCCCVSVWCRWPRWAMHMFAISKMKIELPWSSVPPSPVADVGRHVAHAHVAHLYVMARRLLRARAPAAQHMRDARIGPVGVVRSCAWFMVAMSGRTARPDVVVVVGGDAHELRALDQECRMAGIADAHLVGIERELKCRRHDARHVGGHQARAVLPHLRLGGRRRLRRRRRDRKQCDTGGERHHKRKTNSHAVLPCSEEHTVAWFRSRQQPPAN